MGQVGAVFLSALEGRGELHQHGQQTAACHQGLDAAPVLVGLLLPGIFDLMGHGASELGGEEQIGSAGGQHPRHGIRPNHLVPGVVEFDHRKHPAVQGEHLCRPGACRIDAGIDPFGIGETAGANIERGIRRHRTPRLRGRPSARGRAGCRSPCPESGPPPGQRS